MDPMQILVVGGNWSNELDVQLERLKEPGISDLWPLLIYLEQSVIVTE